MSFFSGHYGKMPPRAKKLKPCTACKPVPLFSQIFEQDCVACTKCAAVKPSLRNNRMQMMEELQTVLQAMAACQTPDCVHCAAKTKNAGVVKEHVRLTKQALELARLLNLPSVKDMDNQYKIMINEAAEVLEKMNRKK